MEIKLHAANTMKQQQNHMNCHTFKRKKKEKTDIYHITTNKNNFTKMNDMNKRIAYKL